MLFEDEVNSLCERAFLVLRKIKLKFRPMRRTIILSPKRGFVVGRTNLKTGLITIDILTPKKRQPKKISSILRTLCHEIAHYQKKPYRQFYKGRYVIRQHYPSFYKQVNKNVARLKQDKCLKKYFI